VQSSAFSSDMLYSFKKLENDLTYLILGEIKAFSRALSATTTLDD
jgi:hypothetical protein